MKITDQAKLLITEALVSNDCDCLQVSLQQSDCGPSVHFIPVKLTSNKNPDFINGISVIMDSQIRTMTETITLAVENGKLIIQDDKPSCSCQDDKPSCCG